MKLLSSLLFRVRRLARLFRLGFAVLRLRLARDENARGRARATLATLMADARGLSTKVGQMMAGGEDGDPFGRLTDRLPALPLAEILPSLERALGCSASEIFSRLEPAQAAASLGQVHPAVLYDDRKVAVKIQYPDIALALDIELRLAGLAPRAGPIKTWGFDLEAYKLLLEKNLHRELDYLSEARRQARFAQRVQVDGLRIPRVHLELCRKTVLVQSWEAGVSLDEAAGWPLRDRLVVGKILLETFFISLFEAGEIHADPHPGNILFCRQQDQPPAVVLLDFGCTATISRPRRLALLRLLVGLRRQESGIGLRALCALGFDGQRLAPIQQRLDLLCGLLLEPFLLRRPFVVTDGRCGERSAALLGDLRWWFRSSAPADSLLVVRAFSGLVTQLQRLDIALSWWPILDRCLPRSIVEQAAAYDLPALPVKIPTAPTPLAARFLKVRVVEDQQELVALTFPAIEILNLPSLVPGDVRRAVEKSGIDLSEVVDRIREQQFTPQELFCLERGPKLYRVWLE